MTFYKPKQSSNNPPLLVAFLLVMTTQVIHVFPPFPPQISYEESVNPSTQEVQLPASSPHTLLWLYAMTWLVLHVLCGLLAQHTDLCYHPRSYVML